MSAIVSGIFNSTVGLLCSKLRDYTAERLHEGDLNDEQCREIIVRELDDIKSKLDGLSRKDLLASLSFFKEGVTRLYASLETSGEASDKPNTSKAHIEDECEVKGATATRVEQLSGKQAERDVLQSAFELSEAIGNLTIASQERYKLAKESFKESKRLATEAFNNVALSTEDRLMASKLRIASRILEGLDDPDVAVKDCLLYLKELHDLPAVQAMFSVWQDADKGITSRLRARFNKKNRNDNIESIQMLNALLIDLTMKFTNMSMGLFNWPTIKIGMKFYHSLLDRKECPRFWKFDEKIPLYISGCGLTSKGEILSVTWDRKSLRKSGECELFCTIPSENDEDKICCSAVDEKDNVFILVKGNSGRHKLLTFDANGNVKADRYLQCPTLIGPQICVTKDGLIVIYHQSAKAMYIYDRTNVGEDYNFFVPFQDKRCTFVSSLAVSNKNDIILAFASYDCQLLIYVLTMDGQLKRRVEIPRYFKSVNAWSVIFNHVNEAITISVNGIGARDSDEDTMIYTFSSNTGELLHHFNIQGRYERLMSHPNGHIILASNDDAIILQM